ncbi:MAG: hypothetical protein AAFR84_06570 [Pseudomonadota bacterium]
MSTDAGLTAAQWRERIVKLEEALAGTHLRIAYRDVEGQSVDRQFKNVAELKEAIGYARRRLAELEGTGSGSGLFARQATFG